jgi:hypothetical protein
VLTGDEKLRRGALKFDVGGLLVVFGDAGGMMGISAEVRLWGHGQCAHVLPGMATRSGWRCSACRQDPGVLAPDALVTEEDMEKVTKMHTGKIGRIGTKRGRSLPQLRGFIL